MGEINVVAGLIAALVSIVVGGLTIIATVVGGFVWISGKLEAIRKDLAEVDKSSVSHSVCSERRDKCPCVDDIREIKERIERK